MLTKDELIKYLSESTPDVLLRANGVRKKHVGDSVYIRGLIEFSNICSKTCHYCGIRGENKDAKRFVLTKDEIFLYAKTGKNLGFNTIVLQSGESDVFSDDEMCQIIERIKGLDVAITLSIGEKTYEQYRRYKNAGADRYLLRIETTDKDLYKKYHPKMSFENRIKCLYNLKELGYETGTGSIVGLPEQTIESLAEDILFYQKLDADMVGIGAYIPHPQTPLGNCVVDVKKNFDLAMRTMALTRIVLPNINIPATTAMETINPEGKIIALQSGANVVMANLMDFEYKKDYSIYPNKSGLNSNIDEYIENLKLNLDHIGRFISFSKGFRYDNQEYSS